jgi:phosphoglycerate dehydrogenase-like enzyme
VSFVSLAGAGAGDADAAAPPSPDAALAHAAEAAGAARAPSLAALLAGCDAVSLHCSDAAAGAAPVLGEAQLAALPRGAFLVHITAPGGIDAAALKRALCSGALGGAAIDAPDGDAWLEAWARDAPNLIITPRAARHSEEAYAEAALAAAAVALDLIERQQLAHT